MRNKLIFLKYIFFLCSLDAFGAWLMILFYTTGVDLVSFVNYNFLLIFLLMFLSTVRSFKLTKLSSIYIVVLLISFLKMIYLLNYSLYEIKHIITYFLGLLIPIVTLSFTSNFNRKDNKIIYNEINKFAIRYAIIGIPGLLVYWVLHSLGHITYFGLGISLHYIFPLFLINKQKRGIYTILFFTINILAGKRAQFVSFISQILIYQTSKLRKKSYICNY